MQRCDIIICRHIEKFSGYWTRSTKAFKNPTDKVNIVGGEKGNILWAPAIRSMAVCALICPKDKYN